MRVLLLVGLLVPLGCGSELDLDVEFEPAADNELKADSAEAGVEIKVTLAESDTTRAQRVFRLAARDPSEREVYFFDTGDLALKQAGVILRARHIKDAPDDTTVKIRPLASEDVESQWFDREGFKCEEDWVGSKHISSCSFSRSPDHPIEDTVEGDNSVKKLFSDSQEGFLADYASEIPWSDLRVLGPTDARVWKLKTSGFSGRLTVEEWRWPNGRKLVELSTRAEPAKAAATQNRLMVFLRNLGFSNATAQETKTQIALEYFTR
jgi:hypothetical protein